MSEEAQLRELCDNIRHSCAPSSIFHIVATALLSRLGDAKPGQDEELLGELNGLVEWLTNADIDPHQRDVWVGALNALTETPKEKG